MHAKCTGVRWRTYGPVEAAERNTTRHSGLMAGAAIRHSQPCRNLARGFVTAGAIGHSRQLRTAGVTGSAIHAMSRVREADWWMRLLRRGFCLLGLFRRVAPPAAG